MFLSPWFHSRDNPGGIAQYYRESNKLIHSEFAQIQSITYIRIVSKDSAKHQNAK
ncbi:MAG: hypothetical protein ACFFDY_07340 [Candidatus Thorarchaeota archaeon]